MSQNKISNTHTFYKLLCFRLRTSELAYKTYLNERTYATANVILFINKEIIAFIRENIFYAKNLDVDSLTELVLHFSGWISDFELQVKKLSPEPNSIFIFERSKGLFSYPKEFIAKLYVDWYKQ